MTDNVAGTIRPKREPPPAPDGLGPSGTKLWKGAVETFQFSAETELVQLESLCRSLDRAEDARELVEEEGITVVTESSGAVHVHPAVRVEAEARREVRLGLRALGLIDANGLEVD